MQQNSPFYFFQKPAPVADMIKAKAEKTETEIKARWRLLILLFGAFLMLGSVSAARAQVADSTLEKGAADSVAGTGSGVLMQRAAIPGRDSLPAPTSVSTPDRPGIDTTAVKPDSTLRQALRPFSFRLPGSKEHTPKGATIRSLILPGWGQAYNHEYWKVPLAVAAVGIPIYLFIDNSNEYNAARRAYSVVFEEMPVIQGGKGKLDPAKFRQIDQKFQDAYNRYKKVGGNYVTNFLSTVQNYRNTFRQYRDYSIVAAVLGWGLQIADATVFGHLHGFDVSNDLSLKVRPVYFQYARIPGIGLSFSLK